MDVISKIQQRIKLFFCKDKELYSSLYEIMGFYPRRAEIYRQALSHKSVRLIGAEGIELNNERLEFLGDAILGAVVSEIIYIKFQDKQEGFLTVARSKIVQRETLNRLSEQIGLDKLINDSARRISHVQNINGNAFEALMGAIYLDRGYGACMEFVRDRLIAKQFLNLEEIVFQERNFKSRLLEWSQKNKFLLSFESTEVKTDGVLQFRSRVLVEELIGGIGMGHSKKTSQQAAAEETLKLLKKKRTFYRNVLEAKKKRQQQSNET